MVFRMCREAEIAKSRTAASPTRRHDKRFTRRYRTKQRTIALQRDVAGRDIVLCVQWRPTADEDGHYSFAVAL
jgi:hypothetical protein